MVVFFGCDHALLFDDAGLAAQGWHWIGNHAEQGEDGQGTYLLYREVDGTEPDPIEFVAINDPQYTNGVQGLLSVYRGVDLDKPIETYQETLVDTGAVDITQVQTPTPEVTTTQPDCLLIAGLSPDSAVDAPLITAWPEGFVENRMSVTNPPTPFPYGWANIYTAERHLHDAGTVPASSFEWEITGEDQRYYGALSFILALAPK
jgi:hypothetical protein